MGATFDIHHPRINLLAQTFIKIGIPEPKNPDPLNWNYTEFVPLTQITKLEPLPSVSSAQA